MEEQGDQQQREGKQHAAAAAARGSNAYLVLELGLLSGELLQLAGLGLVGGRLVGEQALGLVVGALDAMHLSGRRGAGVGGLLLMRGELHMVALLLRLEVHLEGLLGRRGVSLQRQHLLCQRGGLGLVELDALLGLGPLALRTAHRWASAHSHINSTHTHRA